MVLHSAVARVVLGQLMAPLVVDRARVAAEVAVDAEAVGARVVEVVVVAMPAVETGAGDAHAVTHFRYSTGPGAA
jgi:hypothetical protein